MSNKESRTVQILKAENEHLKQELKNVKEKVQQLEDELRIEQRKVSSLVALLGCLEQEKLSEAAGKIIDSDNMCPSDFGLEEPTSECFDHIIACEDCWKYALDKFFLRS